MGPVRILLILVALGLLSLSVTACGGDDDTATTTVTVTAPAGSTAGTDDEAADKGQVVEVELGEDGSTYFVKRLSRRLRPAR